MFAFRLLISLNKHLSLEPVCVVYKLMLNPAWWLLIYRPSPVNHNQCSTVCWHSNPRQSCKKCCRCLQWDNNMFTHTDGSPQRVIPINWYLICWVYLISMDAFVCSKWALWLFIDNKSTHYCVCTTQLVGQLHMTQRFIALGYTHNISISLLMCLYWQASVTTNELVTSQMFEKPPHLVAAVPCFWEWVDNWRVRSMLSAVITGLVFKWTWPDILVMDSSSILSNICLHGSEPIRCPNNPLQ